MHLLLYVYHVLYNVRHVILLLLARAVLQAISYMDKLARQNALRAFLVIILIINAIYAILNVIPALELQTLNVQHA